LLAGGVVPSSLDVELHSGRIGGLGGIVDGLVRVPRNRPDHLYSVHDSGTDETETASDLEPVSGFEPLACRLQEVRPNAPSVLAAQMTRIIALMALTALGLFGKPVHEPVHDWL
jgi:hypothetical protein